MSFHLLLAVVVLGLTMKGLSLVVTNTVGFVTFNESKFVITYKYQQVSG